MKDLTNTSITRQNILNNQFAVTEIQNAVGIKGIMFENEYKFIFKQITDFFEVTERTIRDCIAKNEKELSKNGYEVLVGKRLIDFKLVWQHKFGSETDFTTKTTVLGIFNIGYLESALEFIQNDDYYPAFEDKLVHLIWSINRNHAFSDGNKRLSITIGVHFRLFVLY
jgi:hypothetical protein